MMKKMLCATLGACSLLVSVPSYSQQIRNGTFSQGGALWEWKEGQVQQGLFPVQQECKATVPSGTALATWDSVYTSGMSAQIVPFPLFDIGDFVSVTKCREISQSLDVPIGQSLTFHMMPGALLPNQSGNFKVSATMTDVLTGYTRSLALNERKLNRGEYCWETPCTGWREFSDVNISDFWGRRVTLRIGGESTFRRIGTSFSGYQSAQVDTVYLETTPGPTSSFGFVGQPLSGLYFNPTRSGHGIHLSKSAAGDYTLLWYTYTQDGLPIWYATDIAKFASGVWTSKLYKATWDAASNSRSLRVVGDVQLRQISSIKAGQYANESQRLELLWDFHEVNGDQSGFEDGEQLEGLLTGGIDSGLWYEPSSSGWGISIAKGYQSNPAQAGTIAAIAFVYDGSEPRWLYGQAVGDVRSGQTFDLTFNFGTFLCPWCFGQPSQSTSPSGSMRIALDVSNGFIDARFPSGRTWVRGSQAAPISMARLTQ